ncbi:MULTISPECIES: HlyC/CorC family transporter [Legionella]|uniref:Mg2 and Co2 transporter n=1 Tax=Legionella donaldsonii TaxID=45060 RepID=A0A378J012_9GAMM|nr:HlyC/CorC family transporter [Legionella donaldsonii]MCC5015045.1 HlyC/CorC family transporter [Legionella sp. 31fI33]STX40849.1 Mg2 and Co2 transporter [Legionella donaldsonii]
MHFSFSLPTLLIALVLLVLLSAFFSGAEIGMMSLNRYRLRHLVKKNDKQAIRVNQMLARPDKLLSVVLIGNTLANIVASTLATLVGQRLYGDAGVAIATLILTLVILVFSEMTPKTLAALHPQQVAFTSSFPLQILQIILAPLVQTITWITNTILRLFGVTLDKVQKEALSGEELRSVVHEAGGLLPVEHKSMLISLLDLEQATVEDIMIPTADIIGLDLEQSWHDLLEQLETAQHTRLPLYRDTIDNLVGMVHVRSVLNLALEERLDMDNLLKIADAPYFIPEATPLNVQILNFQKMKKRSCFVVDEYGELLGLVTMEDILEEVVGEFTTDIAALSKDITQQEDGSVIVDASITLRHLKRLLNWQLPSLGPRTLSGLIIEHLGYIPPPDCCLQIESFQIEILMVSDNMIKTVRMLKVNKKRK